MILLSLAVLIGLMFLGKETWLAFYLVLNAVGFSAWWMGWFMRKREAGALLLKVGRTLRSKLAFLAGWMYVGVAILQTRYFFKWTVNEAPQYIHLEKEAAMLVFWWAASVCAFAMSLSKLELRENGICFMYSLITWQRISEYVWDLDKPNLLIVRFKPRFPLWPRFMNIDIPGKHKYAVNSILEEQLSGKLEQYF